MKKTFLFLTLLSGIALTTQAHAQDYMAARLRMERELNYICSVSIGAPRGSVAYLECRDYYDRRFYEYGLDWDYLTPAQVTAFLARTNPFIRKCRNQGLISTLLWGCIRDYEDGYYRDWHHRNPHFKPRHDYRPHFGAKPHQPAPKPHHDVKPHAPEKPHAKPAGHAPTPAPKAEHKRDNKQPKRNAREFFRHGR